MSLTFDKVSRINLSRALVWHPNGIQEWSVSDWGVAMAGEAGEVCDAIKKLRRLECKIQSLNISQPIEIQQAVNAIAQEIGDTFLYLDLLSHRLDISLERSIIDTFNRVSIREGFLHRL